MIYTNTDKDYNYRSGMGKWMKDYSLKEKGRDWDFCVGLSYRSNINQTLTAKKYWMKLYEEIYKVDNSVYGFVVDELDKFGKNIHHHLIVGSELDIVSFSEIVSNNWDKRGVNWVDRYLRSSKWDMIDYMCKHINKTDRNVMDVFNSL